MKNKESKKYMKLSILSLLLILPLATALEQTCQIPINVTTQLNITNLNQSINLSTEMGQFIYNSSINFNDTKSISILRNASCSLNISEGNVSALWSILYNISKNLEVIAQDSADRVSYFPLYSSCLANLSSCQTRLNISDSKEDFQSKYNSCVTDKTNIEAAKNNLDNQLNAPATSPAPGCQSKLQACEKWKEDSHDWWIYFSIAAFIAGGGLVWVMKVRPKIGKDSIHKEALPFQELR